MSAGADRSESATASGWPLTQDGLGGNGQTGGAGSGPRLLGNEASTKPAHPFYDLSGGHVC